MSVARPFSSIMGDMDVDQALSRLGISRSQLQDHTARMKHFLSSDSTFVPTPGSRVFSQHASQPSLPSFPSTSASSGSALARSRSLDSSGQFASSAPAGSTVAHHPQETPSRTRKADSNDGLGERDSKRRRGEKTARNDGGRRAQNASGGSDPARRLYTTEPVPPPPQSFPSLMHQTHAAVQQDVFYTSHMSPVASSSRAPSVAGNGKNNSSALLSVADVRATGVSPPSQSSHQSSSASMQPLSSTSQQPSTSRSQTPHGPQALHGEALLSRYPLPPGFAWQPFEPKTPYHLPPGPFSQDKPALPYAALIGQALLASYFHRLPLHDITTYITVVHPYYKRSEATWQNSLRHNLSTNDSFERVDRHPDDHLTHGPCWRITPGHEKFFVGGVYCKPRNSPTKPKQEVKPDPLVHVKQELFPAQIPMQMPVAGSSQQMAVAGPSQHHAAAAAGSSQHRYYRDRSTTAPSGSASRAATPLAPAYAAAFAAPNPTFNANYYRETTWKNTNAIPVYPPPGHALAYVPAPAAFRSVPPVIASSSPAPQTPGGRVRRLRALLDDADSESDEERSPVRPVAELSPAYPTSQHTRSISASTSASLMDRRLLGGAPTSPITASLMERTLERKARQRHVLPKEYDDELELTPSPVLAALPVPEADESQELDEPVSVQELDPPTHAREELDEPGAAQDEPDERADAQQLTIDPEILASMVGQARNQGPDELDPALTLDGPFDALAQADAEEDAEEQDDSGYRSSNSSPGVPLALLLSKRKNDKQRQQELSAAFSFSLPPQSPLSDLRSTAARNIRKKGKRKTAKAKKKRPAPAEDEEAESDDDGQELVVPERYATPPPVFSQSSSSQTLPLSPFRTPLTSRNTAGALARSKPDGGAENEASPGVRRDIFSTPKRSFVGSPFKTPILAEDPFNATTLLEQQLELLPQGSPLRDRPWGDALYNGYSLYGHDFY